MGFWFQGNGIAFPREHIDASQYKFIDIETDGLNLPATGDPSFQLWHAVLRTYISQVYGVHMHLVNGANV